MALDLAILAFVTFLVWRGASNGLLWSLTGPLGFIVATVSALLYYKATKDMLVSMGIGLIGPFFLQWFLIFLLRSFGGIKRDARPSVLSCFAGAAVMVCWGMLWVLPVIFLFGIMPALTPQFDSLRRYIDRSYTFQMSKPLMNPLLKMSGIDLTSSGPVTPSTSSSASPESGLPPALEALRQDARMQALLQDTSTAKAIAERNYAALMSNPKFLELVQDPGFVQKALSAYKEIGQTPIPGSQQKEETNPNLPAEHEFIR